MESNMMEYRDPEELFQWEVDEVRKERANHPEADRDRMNTRTGLEHPRQQEDSNDHLRSGYEQVPSVFILRLGSEGLAFCMRDDIEDEVTEDAS